MKKIKVFAQIRKGWMFEGKKFEILGIPIKVSGQMWRPIRYLDENDPDWIKEAALDDNHRSTI